MINKRNVLFAICILSIMSMVFVAASRLLAVGEEATGETRLNRDEIKRVSEKYGFLGPETIKIGENMNNLRIQDFDGDGRFDFLVVNGTEKKVSVFYQTDKLDPRFMQESFVMEKAASGMTTGEVNGDGLVDIVFLDSDGKVNILFHEKDKRAFSSPKEIELDNRGSLLKVEDINNDKKDEIIVLNNEDINIILHEKDRSFRKAVKYENTMKKVADFHLADADGDGLKDLIFFEPSGQLLSFRKQLTNFCFAPEITQKIEGIRIGDFEDITGDKRNEMLAMHAQTNAFKIYRFSKPDELKPDEKKKFNLSRSRDYFFKIGIGSSKGLAIGDVNADKLFDVVYVDSSRAEISLYLQDESGNLAEKKVYPSLMGMQNAAIGDINNDGKNEVVIISSKEKCISFVQMTPEGRLSFPKPLFLPEETPTAFVIADMNQDKKLDLVYGARNEKAEKGFIFVMGLNEKGEWSQTQKIELTAKQGTVVDEIKAIDVDNDKQPDLILFFQMSSPIIFTQQKDGSFKDITTGNTALTSLLNKLNPVELTWGDVNRDGINEMLISQNNFVRSLDWNGGSPQVIDQYNGKSSESVVQTAFTFDLDSDKIPEVILYDSQLKLLTILKKNVQGVYEILENIEISYLTIKNIFAEDMNNDGKKDIMLFGQERFGILYSDVTDPQFEPLADYATRIKRGVYTRYAIGDVNGDGKKDVVLIEGKRHNMEILSIDEKNKLNQELTFQVFEDPETDLLDEESEDYRWRNLPVNEPRDIKIIDINNDKKDDIILLAHRNLLIYLQE
ncbi:MAG: VCBS repeat-containing protein [Planctomycetes bacterium]|nr:VCBS repeat-containing protein [Planctomycetota bacterium]